MIEPSLITPDTNVLVSGVISRGYPKSLLALWRSGELHLATSEPLIAELRKVLMRPYFAERIARIPTKDFIDTFLAEIRASAVVVAGVTPIQVCRDSKDNMVFACALEAKAGYIVSGDKDVLVVEEFQSILTMTPKDFIEWFQIQQFEEAA